MAVEADEKPSGSEEGGKRQRRLLWAFLGLYTAGSVVGGAGRSLGNSAVQSMERDLGLSSSRLGGLASAAKFAYILFSVPVAYLATRQNRARWIGAGLAATSVGCGLFALPHLLLRPSTAAPLDQTPLGLCSAARPPASRNSFPAVSLPDGPAAEVGESGREWLVAGCLFLGHVLLGLGQTLGWAVAAPLVDDQVPPDAAPLYIGLLRFLNVAGPFVGLLGGGALLNVPSSLRQPAEGEPGPDSPSWIGAYWLGYLIVFGLLLPPALCLLAFPGSLERPSGGTRAEEHKRLLRRLVQPSPAFCNPRRAGEWCGRLWRSVAALFRSRVFCAQVCVSVASGLGFRGWHTFVTKLLHVHYGFSQAAAALVLGLSDVGAFAVGNVAGGWLTHRLRLDGRRAASFVLCGFAVYSGLYWGVHGLSCTSSAARVGAALSLPSNCSTDCACSGLRLEPVCGAVSGRVWASACEAGCRRAAEAGVFGGCDCAADGDGGRLSASFCRDDCAAPGLVYSLVLGLSGLVQGLIATPQTLFLLRSVPPETRSLGLGVVGFLKSILGSMPSPLLYGAVIDGTC